MPGRALETISSQQDLSFTSPLEIQEYTREITQNVYQIIEKILSIPADQQTFENTLRPWNRLKGDLASSFNQLNALAEGSFFSSVAHQAIEDFRMVFTEISQDNQLYEALIVCSQKINHNPASTPFELYIANQFLSNNRSELSHIRGSAQEKNTNETDFTVLNLKSADFPRGQALDLVKIISLANADVICIHEISVNDAHDVFHALQDDYAHFLYLDADSAVFHFSEYRGGILIASKCNIEKARFNRAAASSTDLDEGFFDFIIKNGEESLGHIYITNFKEDPYKETQAHQFMSLIERMQGDILKMEEELIPFFLCGDFRALQSSQEGKILMDTYFRSENNRTEVVHALLLQSLPAFPHEVLSPEYSISTTSIALLGDYAGSVTLIKKENAYSIDDILKNIGGNYWNGNSTILCGHAEISGGRETDGSSKVEASVSTSTETDRGTVSFEVSGGVYQDQDGNNSGRIESTISIDW
ncbi:MAG: endonuclease/exonuclease/phosphatase family protein [Anaerolineae bacterium]